MPARRQDGGGGRGADGFPRSSGGRVVRQAERITKKSASIQDKYAKKTVKSTTDMLKRIPRLKKHPSGNLIDPVDGTILDRNLNIIKRGSKMNTVKYRANAVKNSPAAKDLKKISKRVPPLPAAGAAAGNKKKKKPISKRPR